MKDGGAQTRILFVFSTIYVIIKNNCRRLFPERVCCEELGIGIAFDQQMHFNRCFETNVVSGLRLFNSSVAIDA